MAININKPSNLYESISKFGLYNIARVMIISSSIVIIHAILEGLLWKLGIREECYYTWDEPSTKGDTKAGFKMMDESMD